MSSRIPLGPRSVVLALAAAALAASACSSASEEVDRGPCSLGTSATEATPTGAASFVPFAQHFAGFHAWPSTPGTSRRPTTAFHVSGNAKVYYNRPPAKGSGTFPVGTVIVKETLEPDPRDRSIFALVKRGGDYNPNGAPGWEWFELDNVCGTDAPRITWRGLGPPAGEKYGGDPNGCATCHSVAADNDFIMTDGLALSTF